MEDLKKRLELIKAKLGQYAINGIDSGEDLESINAELDKIKKEIDSKNEKERKIKEDELNEKNKSDSQLMSESMNIEEAADKLIERYKGGGYNGPEKSPYTGDLEKDAENL